MPHHPAKMMSTGGPQLKWLTLLVTLWAVLNTASSSDIIDLVCSSEADCSNFRGPSVNSTCVDGSCKCVLEPSGNKTTCKPIVTKVSNKIGGQCPCVSENSYCNEKTQLCVCKDGFLPSREKKKCISKSVPLGQPCEIDEQCLVHDHFSHCDDKHRNCTCLNHFAVLEDACHSVIAAPNSTTACEKDADCAKLTANATCHEKRCICGKGFVGDGEASNCLPVARYEGNCTDSNQCIATLGVGSVCHEAKCVCSEAFFPFQDHARTGAAGAKHEVQTICKRKILYGSSCNDDKECYQFHQGPHEQTMECYHSECVCSRGYIERDGYCYPENSGTSFHRLPFWITLFVAVLAFLSHKCLC